MLSCASPPELADPGASGLWGYVELVPHTGAAAAAHGDGAYGDRRVADARRVDYDKPGFAVVYLGDDDGDGTKAATTLRLAEGLGGGLRYEPHQAAMRAAGVLRIENATSSARVVSAPAAGLLRVLAPGEGLELRASAGPLELFAPGADEAHAVVFAAPGPFAIVGVHGRYELTDLRPGPHRVGVWHPRFPPTVRSIDLARGDVERLDLVLGVGLEDDGASRGAR